MDPKKKTSLFSQAMKEKKAQIQSSKGFPMVVGFEVPVEEKKQDIKPEQVQSFVNDLFDDITQEEFQSIQEENKKTIEAMSHEEIANLQELFRKELGENVIEKLKIGTKKFNPTVLEDKVLKSKMVDDFNSAALKNTIFSEQANEQRDFDTFIDRVYYDNYGNFAIYDEKTFEDLRFHDSDFNSFSQLVNGLPGVQGTVAYYVKILQKLIMIVEIWERNLKDDFVCLTFEKTTLKINLKIIMKKIFIDYRLIEGIIYANNSHGYVNFSLGLPSFELINLLFSLTYKDELNIIKYWGWQKNFFENFDKLILEESFFEYLLKEGYLDLVLLIFQKMDLNEEIYSYFLNLITCVVAFTAKSHFNILMGGFSKILMKVIKFFVNNFKISEYIGENKNSSLIQPYLSAIAIILQKDKKESLKYDVISKLQNNLPEIKDSLLFKKLVSVIENPEATNIWTYINSENISQDLESLGKVEDIATDPTYKLEIINRALFDEENFILFTTALKSDNTILKSNLFKSCKELSSNSSNSYIEYFSSETSLTLRDILSKNLYLVDVDPEMIKKLSELIIVLKLNISKIGDIHKEILRWAELNLDNFLLKLMARLDLWFITQDKMKARNNSKFSIMKKIGFEFFGDLTDYFQKLLLVYLEGKNKDDLPKIIKLTGILENFKETKISLSTYEEILKLAEVNYNFVPEPVFRIPAEKKLDSKLYQSKQKYYEEIINILGQLFEKVLNKHSNSLPIHKIFIKILIRIFSSDKTLYLDKKINGSLRSILLTILPHLSFDLLGIYSKNNLHVIDKLIDQYAFNSYGDQLFSSIIFIFGARQFPEDIRKAVWTNVASYPHVFYEALQEKVFSEIQEALMCKKRPHFEIQNLISEIKASGQDLGEEFCSNKFLLHKVLSSYLAFK